LFSSYQVFLNQNLVGQVEVICEKHLLFSFIRDGQTMCYYVCTATVQIGEQIIDVIGNNDFQLCSQKFSKVFQQFIFKSHGVGFVQKI